MAGEGRGGGGTAARREKDRKREVEIVFVQLRRKIRRIFRTAMRGHIGEQWLTCRVWKKENGFGCLIHIFFYI